METKMEEQVTESQPLNMTGGWEAQVNGRADKAEEDRRKKIGWAEQQKANRIAERRATMAMNTVAAALFMIAAGGFALNYMASGPAWVPVTMAVGGIAAMAFVIGWICGHRCRR